MPPARGPRYAANLLRDRRYAASAQFTHGTCATTDSRVVRAGGGGWRRVAARGAETRRERLPRRPTLGLMANQPTTVRVGQTSIEVAVGDLTQADTDTIVNAANSQLWMGGGVAGAIKRAAGEEVEREAVAQGPIRPGEAVATSAGNLQPPIRHVIHAATMGPDLLTSEAYIRAATASALARAVDVGAGSIALPALGTGVGGFSMGEAARVMVEETKSAARAGRAPARVVFVLRNEESADAFVGALTAG